MSTTTELEDESTFIRHLPCPNCGSTDANSEYSDGHTHCFSCGHHTNPTSGPRKGPAVEPEGVAKAFEPVDGDFMALPKRKLSLETCRHWGYTVNEARSLHVANYRNREGELVGQKLRGPNKDFKAVGKITKTLYGCHLWRDGGKKLVITEGELDALSLSQVQGHKWPVVSIPGGAQGAPKAIRANIDWLQQWEEVIFMFDMDDPGQEAAKACCSLLPPGKAKIARLPLKDPSEMLMAGREKELLDAVWSAKEYRPDGIVSGTELRDKLRNEPPIVSHPFPWKGLNEMYLGLREGETLGICAGTGSGKSQLCRELAHHILVTMKHSLGYIALEESQKRSALGIVSVEMGKPLHILGVDWEDKKFNKAWDKTIGSGRYYSYDHFGSLESENLLAQIRYLVTACGCKWIILDHISIVVSGLADGDERRIIDNLCTNLRSLVQELQFGLIFVTHLKRVNGKPAEEGGKISLSDLRGSGGIAQLADSLIASERDQQHPDKTRRNTMVIRGLKNRFKGDTGVCTALYYDDVTCRLQECSIPEDDEDQKKKFDKNFPKDGDY